MTLTIFTTIGTCHLLELFLWMLGSFLIGYFFWRWWFKNKCQNEVDVWKKKYEELEHKLNTTVKASKVTAKGVKDPAITNKNFVDGVAKASSATTDNTSIANNLSATKDEVKTETVVTPTPVKEIKKDDLTKIEGIGPKIQDLLYDDSIVTYNNLADSKVSSLETILDNAGPRYRMHDPKTWPEQARLAADNKWDELKKWQDELKGGVATGGKKEKTETVVKDDLTKVEGIGPKINGLLNDDGIYSFKQLSEASVERIQKVLDAAGPRYRVHKPGTWPEQAKLAAEGKWEELKKWQDNLKGGR